MTPELLTAVTAARDDYHVARRDLYKLYAIRAMRHSDPERAVNQVAQVGIDRAFEEMKQRLDRLLQAQRDALLPPLAELEAAAVTLRQASQEYLDAVVAGRTDRDTFQAKVSEAEALFQIQLDRFAG